MTEKEYEWRKLINTGKVKVIMDNDGWWFAWKDGEEPADFDPDGDDVWFGGGEGPYGLDLLAFVLSEMNIEMEMV